MYPIYLQYITYTVCILYMQYILTLNHIFVFFLSYLLELAVSNGSYSWRGKQQYPGQHRTPTKSKGKEKKTEYVWIIKGSSKGLKGMFSSGIEGTSG